MPDPILQASVAVGVDLSPLREGLKKVEDEVGSARGGKVKVGADLSPLQAGMKQVSTAMIGGAILKQVAFVGGALAKSMNSVVPAIQGIGESLKPIVEVARKFEQTLYNKELKSRIEGTNNAMLKGLYQALGVANKIHGHLNFARESVGKIQDIGGAAGGVLSKLGLRKSGGFNLTAPAVEGGLGGFLAKLTGRSGGGKESGKSAAAAAPQGLGGLAGLLGGGGMLRLAAAGAGVAGLGVLGTKAFGAAAGGGAFANLGGPMKELQAAAKGLDSAFSAIGEKLSKPFLGLARAIASTALPAITGLVQAVGSGLSAALNNPNSMLNGILGTIGSVVDAASMLVRNWDIAWQMIQETGWTRLQNVGEAFSWLGKAATTVAQYVADNWRTLMFDAFEGITTALANLGQNIRDFGSAVYKWLSSGFKGPFDFKVTGLFEGKAAMTSPALNLPEMKLTELSEKLAPLAAALAGREQGRKADTFEAPGKKKGEAARSPAEFMGLVDFAKKAQIGALGADPAKKTAENTGKAVGLLEKLVNGFTDAAKVTPSTAAD
ncbi:MAG: hypothetical protein U0800_08480 [Isosphaeraceae bacterium]